MVRKWKGATMAVEKIVIFHHDASGAVVAWSEVGELIRCKDCKNHDWCSIEDMALNDETFLCKWGERSE